MPQTTYTPKFTLRLQSEMFFFIFFKESTIIMWCSKCLTVIIQQMIVFLREHCIPFYFQIILVLGQENISILTLVQPEW